MTPETSVVLITQKNSGTVEIVSQAMREGADHFLDKNLASFGPNLIVILKTIAKERRRKIFISHGHSITLKLQLKDFLAARMKLDALILADQPNRGLTIVEKLERISERCCFAIIFMTRDDEQADGTKRARQNVIHEIGFFQGKYGRQNVVLLAERGLDLFTNISGIVRIEFETEHFAEVFEPLRAEVDAALAPPE